MHRCSGCHRPIAPEWQLCGWCGAEQAPPPAKKQLFVRMANLVLALQALALTGGTVALAVTWALRGWSVERGQTLGIIWLGVILALALMAWLSVTLSSQSGGEQQGAPQPQGS